MCKHLQCKTAPDGNFYQVLENVSERGVGKAEAAHAGELLSLETYWCDRVTKPSRPAQPHCPPCLLVF